MVTCGELREVFLKCNECWRATSVLEHETPLHSDRDFLVSGDNLGISVDNSNIRAVRYVVCLGREVQCTEGDNN